MPNEATPLTMADFTLGDVPVDIWCAWFALTVVMCGFWYYRYRQAGVLTFDVFFVGLYLYVPIVFMSLFAFSPLNAGASGEWHWRYLPFIREAFYVSMFGVFVFATAALIAARSSTPPPGLWLLHRALNDFWTTRWGLTLLVGMIGLLGALVVATMGVVGSRDAAMENTEFRPLSHLFSSFAVVGMYLSLVEGYRRNSWKLTGLGVVLVLAMLTFGTRKVTVGTMLYYAALRLINARTYKAGRALAVSCVLITLLIGSALLVEAIRQKDLTIERVSAAPISVLFGNNLSELRDFAWILAGWDREPLLGKTYASGLLSWIPSFFLPERKEWSWGLFSTETTDLTGGTHPGLRPTVFAEAYFNFGLVGVAVFAAVLGSIFGRLSVVADRLMRQPDRRERAFKLLCVFLYFEFFLRFQQTAGYFQSYVELLLLVCGLVGAAVLQRLSTARVPEPAFSNSQTLSGQTT